MIFKRRAKLNDSRNEQQHLQIWQPIEQMKEPLSTLALIDLWLDMPKELRAAIPSLAEQHADELEQAGDVMIALRLRSQVSMLRVVQSAVSFAAEAALIQALIAFLGTASDDEARTILATHSDVLLTTYMHNAVKELAEQSLSPHHERFQVRAQMLGEYYRSSKEKVNLQAAMLRLITYYGSQLQSADEQQLYHNTKPHIAQLRHLVEWALEYEFPQALLLLQKLIPHIDLPGVAGEAPDWREYLCWCERALALADRHGTPIERASAQVLCGHAWQRIATLANEDRRACLYRALAAYDQASDFSGERAETSAICIEVMLNRALVIRQLATLPDEDRRAWLYEALAIYDQALHAWSPDPTWLGIAQFHGNRANLLRDVASLPGEDMRARLREALAAYQQAMRFYDLGDQPVSRAETQLNRTTVLIDLAKIAGEDRHAHAVAALAACDEALRSPLREQYPRSYALAQSQRGAALLELSRMPGEDRLARLSGALQAYQDALHFYTIEQAPREHAQTLLGQTSVFIDIAVLYGYEEALRLNASEQDPLHIEMFLGQGRSFIDLATLIGGDRRTWLVRALRSAWMALPIFQEVQDQPGVESALALLRGLRLLCGDDFAEFWREIDAEPAPEWGDSYTIDQLLSILNIQVDLGTVMTFWSRVSPDLRKPLLAAMKERIAQAQYESDHLVAASLGQKLEAIQRFGDCPPRLIRQSWQAVDRYCALREAASRNEHDIGDWQHVIAAGEALLALVFDQNPALDRRAISRELADDYICLALAYRRANNGEAMLEALKHAAGLLPDDARVRAYYARGLIMLGRLREAGHEIRIVRRFDPTLSGLADLEALLIEELRGEEQA